MTADRATIDELLAQERLLLMGASTDEKAFSRAVMRELLEKGYDVVPVNPHVEGPIEGREAYTDVAHVPGEVGAAIVMTSAEHAADAVRECLAAGVPRIWLHRGAGPGSVSDEAIALCREAGVPLVAGECPLMFVKEAGFVHRVHRFGKKVAGTLPQ
ncbi:MAG TPA: CoA-binding protein [Polyangiaceae bacterium LLY-WYZ-15_(1-7)]|nr:CoA-binding protein [Myxococcales bacterium]MAT27842.1 CoA-binding protein [Sandaracinus sp.]HJK91980.1 CoA-binding protein [Polyangiaceae bacterium LLY-WYZ-15_(1-7)]MBJ71278.1 CoA-binding protein [Sandaracinus sp.]HJL05852.1 CoA-binding protein [Polyangiaceae bacterium LLY-WYZ-15_(1-7)]